MVELPDDEYKKLVKDADDNRAVLSVIRASIRLTALIFLVAVVMVSYGCHAIEMRKEVDRANTAVQVREIESQGLEYDQYIDWLDATKGK